MKILIVNTYYYPNMIGGTENSIKILAENLKKNGNEVAVYSVDNNEKLMKENINGILVYRGNAGRYNMKAKMSNTETKLTKAKNKIIEINNISNKKEIQNVLEDFKPDVIHTNNLFAMSNIIWKIAKKKYGIPIVHTLRDYWMLYPIVSKENISKIIFQPFMRMRTKYVDVVTAPSNYTLNKFLENKYFKKAKKKECVPNAINLNLDETKALINERRNNYDKKINFMYVGMLTENKGIRNLIQAFKENENNQIMLNIYGMGALKDFVRKSIKEDARIRYHGQLNAKDLKKEWIKNDVLIVPSIWEEPFGRVVIEANQYGLPVIGANRAGILEIINSINTGIVYQYNNVEELKKQIKEFSDRNNIKKYYSNIEKNIEKYSIDKQIESFEKLYKSIIKKDEIE